MNSLPNSQQIWPMPAPRDLADADLPGFAQGHEGYEAIEAEAADQDGDAGEDFHQGEKDIIEEIKIGDTFVQEGVGIDIVRIILGPDGLGGGEDRTNLARVCLDATDLVTTGGGGDADGVDILSQGIIMKIPDHAYDGCGNVVYREQLAKGFVG